MIDAMLQQLEAPLSVSLDRGGIRLDPEGRVYPSVSKILRCAGVSESIVRHRIKNAVSAAEKSFAEFFSGDITEKELRRATRIENLEERSTKHRDAMGRQGEAQHSILEAIVKGDSNSIAYWRAKKPVATSALEDWFVASRAEPLLCESYAFHDDIDYGCRFDLDVRIAGARWRIELKKTPQVYDEQILQLTAQAETQFCVVEGCKVEVEVERLGVLLLRDGECRLVPVEFDASAWRAFCGFRLVYDFATRRKGDR